MTKVALLREDTSADESAYRAITAHTQAVGRTAGEALDALATQLPPDDADTLIIVRELVPDKFFTHEHRERLHELMAQWRSARDGGKALAAADQSELESLIDMEVQAAARRATAVTDEISK